MGQSTRVVCLSAGLTRPKKQDHVLARKHHYLNYGLVGLATVLRDVGHWPLVVHGGFERAEVVVARLFESGHLPSAHPVLLSVPSAYALPWAREAVVALKRRDPTARIVVGGRWVVGDDPAWMYGQLPGVDLVVVGTAEARIAGLLATCEWTPGMGTAMDRADAPIGLGYEMVENYQAFQPSIEVSRGCGMGCTFCAEATVPLGALKAPEVVAEEMEGCVARFGADHLHPYLEASFFRPDTAWCAALAACLADRGVSLAWRTETRVDALSERHLASLARAGLSVIDLGLESASRTQLVRMGKTQTPDVYLKRASKLLEACRDNGIRAKVNVLLHPGETRATLDETRGWLDAHRGCIKGLSVGPTIVFRFGTSSAAYLASLADHGAEAVDPKALDRDGLAHLHLSAEMDHDAATAASVDLARAFMTARDYYDLKGFSYLPRGTTWTEFSAWCDASPAEALPFAWPNRTGRSVVAGPVDRG
jgi:hypothetical protein